MADWKWYYGSGEQPESYHGPCDTREDAIENGRDYFDGETYSIIEAAKPSTLILGPPSAAEVMERLIDDNDEEWGEVGWDGFADEAGAKVAEAELGALLKAWWAKHHQVFPTPWAFANTRNHEVFAATPAGEG